MKYSCIGAVRGTSLSLSLQTLNVMHKAMAPSLCNLFLLGAYKPYTLKALELLPLKQYNLKNPNQPQNLNPQNAT